MSYLILVRHGESRWNLDNKFTGWVDVPLSPKGVKEALSAAKKIKNLNIDVAFTSELKRAHETLMLILTEQKNTGIFLHDQGDKKKWFLHPRKIEKHEIPVYSSWRLNERYYGNLQGMNKDEARRKFGKEQVFTWRRSYDVKPPKGESLKDVCKRTLPYFNKIIMREVKENKNVLISAHGNSLRAIVKHLDNITDDKIPFLELKTGQPIIYQFSKGKLKKLKKHSFNRPIKI
jgi:2,3-bisphosphoglycerate-dependent phosphoglycerate mutase